MSSYDVVTKIHEIPKDVLDLLNTLNHPFTSHSFLKALEDSASLNDRTGWYPNHLIFNMDEEIVGTIPAYIKTNSWGEYVFDHGWAEAYYRAGGAYYPKLQVSIPFTPVTGPRFLGCEYQYGSYFQALEQETHDKNLSSAHITFAPADFLDHAPEKWLRRVHYQFHWPNNNYSDFDDFLAALRPKKRKNIRQERQNLNRENITFSWLTGADLTEEIMDRFYSFYISTVEKKWAANYLTREFFRQIALLMPEQILLVGAYKDQVMVAAALNFISPQTLYGRYWGCAEDYRFLHFETCYYQAIDYAIRHGLKTVEAGAQGPHKLSRGYLAEKTYSLHYIPDEGFKEAVSHFLQRERQLVNLEIENFRENSPYAETL